MGEVAAPDADGAPDAEADVDSTAIPAASAPRAAGGADDLEHADDARTNGHGARTTMAARDLTAGSAPL